MTPITHGYKISDVVIPPQAFTAAELEDAMYRLTADPDQDALLLESCDLEEADALMNPGLDMVVEAVTAVKNRLDRTMNALVRVFRRYANSVEPHEYPSIGPDRKNALFAYKTVTFTFNDGQTVSILFHSPGRDPMKLRADDTLIAYRWMLNRRDITATVAPERGRDINLQTMARRIMQLVEDNSERFQANNQARQEQQEKLAELEGEQQEVSQRVEALTQQNADLSGNIEQADETIARLRERLAAMGEDGREGSGAGTGSTGTPRFDHYDDALAWVARRASELGISEAEFRQTGEYQAVKSHLMELYDQKMGGGDQPGDDLSRQLRELEDAKEAKYGSRDAGPAAAIMEWVASGGGAAARPGWLHGPNRSSSAWYAAGSGANMNRAIDRARALAEEKGVPVAVLKLSDAVGIPKGYVLAEMPASQGATAAEQARRIFSDIVPTQAMREAAQSGGVTVSVETAVEAPEGSQGDYSGDPVAAAVAELMDAMRADEPFMEETRQLGASPVMAVPGEIENAAEEQRRTWVSVRGGLAIFSRLRGQVSDDDIRRIAEGFQAEAVPYLAGVIREAAQPTAQQVEQLDTEEGLTISGGPFDGFNLRRVANSLSNVTVRATNGAIVGHVNYVDYTEFAKGDASVFTPVDNWRATFSPSLIERLGLSAGQPEAGDDTASEPDNLEALDTRLHRDMVQSIAEVRNIDNGDSPMNRSAFTTSMANRLRTQARNGNTEVVDAGLLLLAEQSLAHGRPILAARNRIWSATGNDMDYYMEIARRRAEASAGADTGTPGGDPAPDDSGPTEQDRITADLTALIDTETDARAFDERLTDLTRRAEEAGAMEALMSQFNQAADRLDALLDAAEQGGGSAGGDAGAGGSTPTGGNQPASEQQQIEDGLQALIDNESDASAFDTALDEWAERAEAAGLMDALDAKLNEAADRLTALLNEEAARVA